MPTRQILTKSRDLPLALLWIHGSYAAGGIRERPLDAPSRAGYSDLMKYLLQRMKDSRLRSFSSGFSAGLASPAEIYCACEYQIQSSSLQDMRSDWDRIGEDLRQVIGREYGEESAQDSRRVA